MLPAPVTFGRFLSSLRDSTSLVSRLPRTSVLGYHLPPLRGCRPESSPEHRPTNVVYSGTIDLFRTLRAGTSVQRMQRVDRRDDKVWL
jgi:hypothetical protein